MMAIDGAVSRIPSTATDGFTGIVGTPINLTWNLVPDGTSIPTDPQGNLSGTQNSNFSSTTAPIGNYTPLFAQAFARWSSLAGLTYVRDAADDQASFFGAGGQLGVRADIRIGGRGGFVDNDVAGLNMFPALGSDMVINTSRFGFTDTSQFYFALLGGPANTRFLNLIMHEHGHGLGLTHQMPDSGSKLMEPTLSTAYYGPQFDDIRRAQWAYGDPFEKTGANNRGRNDSIATASDLGTLANGNLTLSNWGNANDPTHARSISNIDDVDFLRFTVGGSLKRNVTLTVSPFGPSYLVAPQTEPATTPQTLNASALGNLTAAVFDVNGTQIASVNATSFGGNEVVSLPGLLPGIYYLRVGVSQTSNISNAPTQAYNVTAAVSAYTAIAPTVRLSASADSGFSNSDGITNIGAPSFTGTGGAGDSIVVTIRRPNGTVFDTLSTTIANDGTFNVAYPFNLPADGVYAVEAYAQYNAVNTATVNAPAPITLDRVLQAGTFSMLTADDTGLSNSDNITRLVRPRFTFTASEGLSADANATGQSQTTLVFFEGGGTTTFQYGNNFTDGAKTATLAIADYAGNSATRTVNFTVDATAPAVPQLQSFKTSPIQELWAVSNELVYFNGTIDVTLVSTGAVYTFLVDNPFPIASLVSVFRPVVTTLGPNNLDADGIYRVTRINNLSTDVAGNPFNATQPWFDFGYLRADFDGNLTVNFDDLLPLAQNYGRTSGVTHAQGDVNYDGRIDFSDLLILAQSYGQSLLTTAGVSPTSQRKRVSADVLA